MVRSMQYQDVGSAKKRKDKTMLEKLGKFKSAKKETFYVDPSNMVVVEYGGTVLLYSTLSGQTFDLTSFDGAVTEMSNKLTRVRQLPVFKLKNGGRICVSPHNLGVRLNCDGETVLFSIVTGLNWILDDCTLDDVAYLLDRCQQDIADTYRQR